MSTDTERPSGARWRALGETAAQKPSVFAQLDELELSPSDAQILLDILGDCATNLDVRVKVEEAEQGFHASDLAEVARRIRAGSICSAQLTYEYDSAVWLDTLLRAPRGVRLVRLRLSGEK